MQGGAERGVCGSTWRPGEEQYGGGGGRRRGRGTRAGARARAAPTQAATMGDSHHPQHTIVLSFNVIMVVLMELNRLLEAAEPTSAITCNSTQRRSSRHHYAAATTTTQPTRRKGAVEAAF